MTHEEFLAYCEKNGEQPIAYNPETDGEFRCTPDQNGDLLVEVGSTEDGTYRMRKYPHPDVHPGPEVPPEPTPEPAPES